MKKFMGRHLIVDVYGVGEDKLTDKKSLARFLGDFPKELKMRAVRKPIISKISSTNHPSSGFSGFVILYESHISFHTWPEENYIALDVYSCNDFDPKKAARYIKKHFGIKKMSVKSIIRG